MGGGRGRGQARHVWMSRKRVKRKRERERDDAASWTTVKTFVGSMRTLDGCDEEEQGCFIFFFVCCHDRVDACGSGVQERLSIGMQGWIDQRVKRRKGGICHQPV